MRNVTKRICVFCGSNPGDKPEYAVAARALGTALVPGTYDQSFMDSSRMFLRGNGQTVSSDRAVVEYSDPFSGKVYVALAFPDAGVEKGIAARMIARAISCGCAGGPCGAGRSSRSTPASRSRT